jgi:hypothetical protein
MAVDANSLRGEVMDNPSSLEEKNIEGLLLGFLRAIVREQTQAEGSHLAPEATVAPAQIESQPASGSRAIAILKDLSL